MSKKTNEKYHVVMSVPGELRGTRCVSFPIEGGKRKTLEQVKKWLRGNQIRFYRLFYGIEESRL